MRYFFVFLITMFYMFYSFFYPSHIKDITYDVCLIFIKVLMPSIIPMYLLSSVIVNNQFFVNLSYYLLKPLQLFESKNAYSLFLSSILVGNPTTTILTVTKYKKNQITMNDSKILLSCSFMNPLFIITAYNLIGVGSSVAFLYLFCSLVVNLIFLCTNKKRKISIFSNDINFSLFDSINKLSSILLNIFIITLIISYLKLPFLSNKALSIMVSFLDISTGIFNIANSTIVYTFKLILLTILLSSTGLSIIIQSIFFIKQKAPEKIRHFSKIIILSRVKFIVLNTIVFYLLFILLF